MIDKFLYVRKVPITEHISVYIPTVREILECEELYYSLVSMFTAAPIDYMVQLDDIGVDFSTINDFELFSYLFQSLADKDVSLIFGDGFSLVDYLPMIDPQTKQLAFINKDGDIIDRMVHFEIARTLRTIHNIAKDIRKAGNDEARKYMIDRARAKQARAARRKKKERSQLESLIISVVNAPEFKYDFETVLDLTIYQFNACFKQIQKRVSFDNLMIGVYAGTVNAKELPEDQLSWVYTNEK